MKLNRTIPVALAVGLLGCVMLLAELGPGWSSLEQSAGLNWLFKIRGQIEAPSEVVLVNMDSQSGLRLDQPTRLRDWKREMHAQLIDKLVQQNAAVIVFDVFFDDSRPDDSVLAAAMERSSRVVLAQRLVREQFGNLVTESRVDPPAPLSTASVANASFPLPKVPVRVNQFWTFHDTITLTPTLPMIALQVYAQQHLSVSEMDGFFTALGIADQVNRDESKNGLLKFMSRMRSALNRQPAVLSRAKALWAKDSSLSPRATQILPALAGAYINNESRFFNYYGPPATVRKLSYSALWQEDLDNLNLKGKAVFIGGSDLQADQLDSFHTVFSSAEGLDLSGVEIVATAFANLLEGSSLRQPGLLGQLAIVLVFGCLIGVIALMLPGIRGVFAVLAVGSLYFAVANWVFGHFNLWLPLVTPVMVQVPFALLLGLLVQYAMSRRLGENISEALSHYIPDSIATRLLDSADPLTPDLIYGVCLQSDVEGYTTLSERLDPERLAVLSNEYFELLGEAVNANGGERMGMAGDSLTCVWPTKKPSPTKRLQACKAALEMLDAVGVFNSRHGEHSFPTRIGINCGWMTIGNIGGSGHYSYAVTGDAINTTARIEGLNKYLGTRLLTAQVAVEDLYELLLRPVGHFQLKGKSLITPAVEIVCNRAAALPAQIELCQRFADALALYESHDRPRAIESFRALLEDFPGDGPSRFYLDHCQSAPLNGDTVIRLQAK